MLLPLAQLKIFFAMFCWLIFAISGFWGIFSSKSKRKNLCLHLLSLQPYNNRLGLLKLVVKASLVDLQFSQRSALTWSFKTYPLTSITLQDFSLIELNIKKWRFLQSIVSRKWQQLLPHCAYQWRFKLVCDCKQTATHKKKCM